MISRVEWALAPAGSVELKVVGGYDEVSRLDVLSNDLGEMLAVAQSRLNGRMKSPNWFLMAEDGSGSGLAALCEWLGRAFHVAVHQVALPDGTGAAAGYRCLAIDSTQPERVRDAIKEHLWGTRQESVAQGTFADLLLGRYEKAAREFRLQEYGLFIPSRTRNFAAIRTHSFEHRPAFYRYRLALARTAGVPEPMADFLQELFTNCPNHLFRATVFRASGVRRGHLGIEIPLVRHHDHDIIALAERSRGFGNVSSRHESLQKYFLEHDPLTVACEVPVWMEAWEFGDYQQILGTRAPLTGHIDLLRREADGRLGVWDYKPRAAAERHAHLQVFFYALMLSLRTGLPLSAFVCGYFDEKDAYLFRPAQTSLVPA
jgi:hypothetical protein